MKYLFLLLIAVSSLHAKILETDQISDMLLYSNEKTLILFDIDNTLMEPVQTLGSDQWFTRQFYRYQNDGLSKTDALDQALKEWVAIQSITKVQAVDDTAPLIVKALQEKGFDVMGLTTRGLALSHRTVEQLNTLHIDFFPNSLSTEDLIVHNGQTVICRGGILFTSGTHKGKALFKYLDAINHTPKEILFINDKATDLSQIEFSCNERNIPFTGLRYSYTDDKVLNFRQDIADIQFKQFGKILSDTEAELELPVTILPIFD